MSKQTLLPPSPFTRAEAAAFGVSPDVLRRLVRDGALIRERHGLFADAEAYKAWTPRERHLLIASRVAEGLTGDYALGGISAAAWHDLSTPAPWDAQLNRVCLYALGNVNSHIRRDLHILATPIAADELWRNGSLSVTSLPRTAIDVARYCTLPRALIPIDGALRAGVAVEALAQQAQRQKGWPGTRLLLQAIASGSPLSESALESFSIGTFLVSGIPRPDQQVWIRGASGRDYRVDCLWPEAGLVGEADGWGKQGVTEAEWQRNLAREKLREDDIRDAGFAVIRWTFATLTDKLPLIAKRTLKCR